MLCLSILFDIFIFYFSSMEMMNRNDIFKDITDHLKANFLMKEANARALAKQALVENRNLGTDLRPDTIATMSDMCNNIEPVCNNGPFRSITGKEIFSFALCTAVFFELFNLKMQPGSNLQYNV